MVSTNCLLPTKTCVDDSLLSGHDVAKTKYVQQVTASTLYHLMTNAFEHSKEEVSTLYFVE